jgi:Fe-S-cluster containining protein
MPPAATTPQDSWFDPGLRFTCTQCGNCCTGPPGYVWFDDDEAAAIAVHLGVSEVEFRQRYAHKAFNKWTLNEVRSDAGEYDCVFLTRTGDGKRGCSIYPVRPLQCRTWPFWPENLRNERAWVRAAQGCPGMAAGLNGQGDFHPAQQIRIIRDKHV